MHLLYLIPVFFFLFHTCVLGTETQWTFPSEVTGWQNLRGCLQGCFGWYCDTISCSVCPIAMALGCSTVSCMCQADYRQDALNNIASCVNSGCDTTSEQSEAPKIFNTFCGGPVPSSVSVFPNTIGTLLWTEKIVKILSSSVSAGPNTTGTLLWTEKIVKISQTGTPGSTKTGTAQRGIALSWNTLTMLIVSPGAVIIWGWMAV